MTVNKKLIRPFILAAHGDYEMVAHMLQREPSLIYVHFDWGSGELETALDAAAHTGNREIAELLISKGAKKTIFSQAMLGDLTFVENALEQEPTLILVKGAHGIPLMKHAEQGGEKAEHVYQYIKQLVEREKLICHQ